MRYRTSLAAALLACACVAAQPRSAATLQSLPIVDGVARAIPAAELDGPRVLAVIAHPDDEFAFAGALFKTATHLRGVSEILTITDGQGGFKYATFGALLHGLDLTDEAVGRRELPRLRLAEQVESAKLLGVRRLHYLGQRDHRYTTDLAEVLGRGAAVWDLAAVRRALDARLAAGAFDCVLVLAPTGETHAHHQAATLLALEAAARMPAATRPAVLCVEVEPALEAGSTNTPPVIPAATTAAHPLARVVGGPFVFDRTQRFGHRERLDYRALIDAAIARHVTQGSMLLLMGQGEREVYWLLGEPPPDAVARCEAWFARLAEQQFTPREYAESAGTNAGGAAPSR